MINSQNQFVLHPQLENDTFFLGSLDLSDVLLMNDSRYPWLILVPRSNNVFDITDLSEENRQILMEETNFVASLIKRHYKPERLNIAMLGNVVPQLHCHIIARFKEDFAWAKPVWGIGEAVPYSEDKQEETISLLKNLLFQQTV